VLLIRRIEAGEFVISNLIPALRRISHTANLMAILVERRAKEARKAAEAKEAATEGPNQAAAQGNVPPSQAVLEPVAEKVEPTNEATEALEAKVETPSAPLQVANPPAESASSKRTVPAQTFLKAHLSHYAMMNAACEVRRTDFKLYFQPTAFTKTHLAEEERSYLLRKDSYGLQDKFDTLTLAHKNYRAAFAALHKPFPYTDLAGVFGETKAEVYIDSCHFNEEGSTILARAIAADLAPILRARLEAGKPRP
jgi:hypothetical protein